MAEAAQTRVQTAFHRLMNDLDKQCLRKIQVCPLYNTDSPLSPSN